MTNSTKRDTARILVMRRCALPVWTTRRAMGGTGHRNQCKRCRRLVTIAFNAIGGGRRRCSRITISEQRQGRGRDQHCPEPKTINMVWACTMWYMRAEYP